MPNYFKYKTKITDKYAVKLRNMRYEKWSLGYWALKQYVRFTDWTINNKTTLLNTHYLPKDKPILFTPNHQNALSDPMSILLNLPLQPVWLARADIFKNKTAAAILRFLKIMPVYRIRDGKDQLIKNDETFSNSVKVLQGNGALALFPEGAHTGRRQMIAHKKAAPRIVFMAEEMAKENLDIQIIPTGIYYSSYWKFNKNIIVNFGKPIPANQFLEEYKENPGAATLSMRNSIHEGLKSLVVDIRSKQHYNDFETITEVYGRHFLIRQNLKYSIVNKFHSDKLLAQKLDTLENEKPDLIEGITQKANNYFKQVKKSKLRCWLFDKSKNNILHIAWNKLVLIIGLPVFLFGFVFNAIPFFVIDSVIRKKIKDNAFWSTFFLVLGFTVFPIIYLIELAAVSWLIPGVGLKLLFLVSLPFAGKLAFKWYILFLKTAGRSRMLLLKTFKRTKFDHLNTTRTTIYDELDKLIAVD